MANEQAPSGGGFLNTLKRAASSFVEFDEPQAAPATNYKPTIPAFAGIQRGTTPQVPNYDVDMLATLSKTIMARKTAYTALLEAAQNLEKVIPDETMRIKAAFATLGGGRAPSDVLQAIDVHISNLEGERLRFKQATEANVASKVSTDRTAASGKETQVSANNNRLQQIRDETTQLEQANEQLVTDANALRAQADAAEAEIRTVEDRFSRTVDYLKADLTAKKSSLSGLLS